MGVLRNKNWEKTAQVYVLEQCNKTESFRRGFPQNKSASYIQAIRANEVFKKPEVIRRIAELQELKEEIALDEFSADARYVLRRLVEIDRMDILDILEDDGTVKPVKEWPTIWRNFIQQFEIEEVFAGRGDERLNVGLLKKLKWPDKIRNLELLGKHVNVSAFRENVGLTGANGGPVQTITATMTAQEAAELYADTLHDE